MTWLAGCGRRPARAIAIALASLACAAVGCLPEGNRPLGQQLAADRGYAVARFWPAPPSGGPAHLVLAGRPYMVDVGDSNWSAVDISLVTLAAPGASAAAADT